MEVDLINLIQTLGFPIFVVLWFMFRTEKIINRNTEAVDKLSENISLLCAKKAKPL